MAGVSGGALASEVALAGGFGFLAPVYTGVEKFRDEFAIVRSTLGLPSGPLPIGAGFLGWKLEEAGGRHIPLLELALENGVRAIWLSFGEDLGRWIELVRNHDQKTGKSPKTLVFLQVNSVDEALFAVQAWKVDVLVAQGIESGGHGSASAPPVLNLVPEVLSALPPSGAPPVLAAGGLSSGGHLAAFLTLGAAGAVVGTRFLVAEESQYPEVHKRAIIAAKTGSTVRSYVFDQLRDTTGWPAGVDGRGLAIPALAAVERGSDIAQIKEEVAEGTKRGDPSSVIAWAGTGVGPLSRLQPAKDIVRELHEAAVAHLKASSVLVGNV
jgi:nitronate monooxygenase